MPIQNNTYQSEEVQEVLSNKPGFIVSNGIWLLFMLICCVCLGCWFIKYPDVVVAQAKLVSINEPKQVLAQVAGKLIKLKVKEGDIVQKGVIIGYVESIADHDEVLALQHKIVQLQNQDELFFDSFSSFMQSATQRKLGELQQAYQVFSEAILNYKNYLPDGFYLRKKMLLTNDASSLVRLHKNLSEQKKLHNQDYVITKQTFDANQSLKDDNVISDFDYRNEKSKLINKQLTIPQINNSIINNELQQNEIRKQVAELDNAISQQKVVFNQALNTFKSQIDDWIKKYLLIASSEGKIAFSSFIQENQQLRLNQLVCYVNPANSNYYAEVLTPQYNLGKVYIGQDVLLKLPSYPFQEFGVIRGKVDYISNIPTDSGYLTKVTLTDGLVSNQKKSIQYKEGLKASAEIITRDLNLLQRLYNSFIQ